MVVTPEPGVKLYHIWDARTTQPVFHTHQREVRLAKRVLPQIRPRGSHQLKSPSEEAESGRCLL